MAKIMLVEDDNNLRAIYGDRLLAEGHEIVSARDGEEALAVAVKERPDLIISDVMMPKISGFDMLDILRSTPETKDTKVIMMTALSQAEDKERATTLGADKYLVKSQVTLDDVARVVSEILGTDGATPDAAAPAAAPTPPTPTAMPVATPPAPAEPIVSSTPVAPVEPPAAAPIVATEPAVSVPAPAVMPVSEPPVVPTATVPEPPVAPDPAPVEPPAPITVPESPLPAVSAVEPPVPEPVEAPTEAVEQQEVTSQIDQFASSNLPDTPTHSDAPAPEPVEAPTETAAPVPAEPAPASAAPAPTVEVTNETPSTPAAGQKVIEPLSEQVNKPDIHDLYEKEMAQEAANAAVPVPGAGATVTTGPGPDQEPPKDGDPNSIAL